MHADHHGAHPARRLLLDRNYLMIAALVFCWGIAFGEGPHRGR